MTNEIQECGILIHADEVIAALQKRYPEIPDDAWISVAIEMEPDNDWVGPWEKTEDGKSLTMNDYKSTLNVHWKESVKTEGEKPDT